MSDYPLLSIDALLAKDIPATRSKAGHELVARAYQVAESAHEGQKRASGEPYITHCIAVAAILAELQVPPAVVIAGLLHDTVEDTDITLTDIRAEFGDEVAQLVDAPMSAGYHSVVFDASSLASGVYFYRLHAGDFESTKKLLLLR